MLILINFVSFTQTEVKELLESLNKSQGKPTNLTNFFAVSVSNVICNLLMSVRFSIDDPKFRRFNFLIEEGMRLFGQLHTIDYFPKFQYLPGNINIKNKICKNRLEMFAFYQEVIEEHKNTFDENNIRDLIDT
jgi:26-hydroxylase